MSSSFPIRGLRSAASLKRQPEDQGPVLPLAIRGLRSAASLKRGHAHASPHLVRDDPRTQIRGLIEAHGRRSPSSRRPAPDPRTQIRGLIEASHRPGRPGRGRIPIRGLRSAASLKPDERRGIPTIRAVDPRTQIRGLIEADSSSRPPAAGRPDPRTQIRGLIEAGRRPRPWRLRTGRRSADSDPRPH